MTAPRTLAAASAGPASVRAWPAQIFNDVAMPDSQSHPTISLDTARTLGQGL